jgi:hypothetical protein
MLVRAILIACVVLAVPIVQGQCFKPLTDPQSKNTADWNDLVNLSSNLLKPGVIEIQKIEDGLGPINLDFYSVTFKKNSTADLTATFLQIRKAFPLFAHTSASSYGDESSQYFGPYFETGVGDSYGLANQQLWNSGVPRGALMGFVLDNHAPALALAATLKGMKIVLEKGDVLVTCSVMTQIIVSTVQTVADGYHPVSGNRGFGLRENDDGTWTFYTMGADRQAGVHTAGSPSAPYFGNLALSLGFPDRGIPPGPDAVFYAGDKFWREFFGNLEDYLDQHGMTVKADSFIRNSHRYQYPLSGGGPQPAPQ